MNILKDQTKHPIIINGKVAGYLYESPIPNRVHAAIHIETRDGTHLAQGHGDTADDAIREAFQNGQDFAIQFIGRLKVVQCAYDGISR